MNQSFEDWLVETCSGTNISEQDRKTRLQHWDEAPYARYCHPREEHLLPLHVCYGIKNKKADLVFNDNVIEKKVSAFLW